jgi:hypothetical protein
MAPEISPLAPPPVMVRPYFKDMGRPLDKEWLGSFEYHFLDMVGGSEIELKTRRTPGVLYVLGRELKVASSNGGIIEGTASTSQAVDRLVDEEIIDEDLASRGLTVCVRELDLKPFKSGGGANIRARIGDVSCSAYTGYVIGGEKSAIQKTFGISTDQPRGNREPRHHLALGIVNQPKRIITDGFLKDLFYLLNSSLELGPVGGMNAFN